MSKTPHLTWVEVRGEWIQIFDHLGVIKTWRLADWERDPRLVLVIAQVASMAGLGIDIRGLVDTGRLSLDSVPPAREPPKTR